MQNKPTPEQAQVPAPVSQPVPLSQDQQKSIGGAGVRKLPNGFW
jgi:hypothetical protein